ncbi:MAG: phosphoribosyl-AMP cyclohydrolase [Nitriliruptoraceae bacterium]
MPEPFDAQLRQQLRFDANGLIAAIVIDHVRRDVLMLAWMNETSLAQTLAIGETVFYSRSRQQLWHKGATSGNIQRVVAIHVDCDGDALLIEVEQLGAGACHTGERSCFHRDLAVAASRDE